MLIQNSNLYDNYDKSNNEVSKKSFTANWGKPKLIIVKKPK